MAIYGRMEEAIAGLPYGIGFSYDVKTYKAGEQIEYGSPVFGYEGNDIDCYKAKRDTLILTLDADLVTSNVCTLTLQSIKNGVTQDEIIAETFDTDHDTTMDNIVAAIEAEYTNATVTLTDGVNNRQITIFEEGANWTGSGVVTLGASQATITATYTTAQVFLGIARYTTINAYISSTGYYVYGDPVNVQITGEIWINTQAAVSSHTAAYVIYSYVTPANQGLFTGTATNNYDTGCKFTSTNTAAGLARVEINGQNRDATP